MSRYAQQIQAAATTTPPQVEDKITFAEALFVTEGKDDLVSITDNIQRHITTMDKRLSLEKVNYDMKRSALSKAVVAVETSLYDRKILERELKAFADKYAPPTIFSSDSDFSDEDDDDDGEYEDEDDDDDDSDYYANDQEGEEEYSDEYESRRSKKKKKNKKKRSRTQSYDDKLFDMLSSKKLIAEHEKEEEPDAMYSLLQEKEHKLEHATSTLVNFSKRVVAMYRAFQKIYGAEAGGNNAIAIRIFEQETLRQLHLMETASNQALTLSSQEAQQKSAKEKQYNVHAMKDQIHQLREHAAKTNKIRLQQEDTMNDQSNRIDVLEIAAKELTTTVHKLRMEIRTMEEAEAKRQSAERSAANRRRKSKFGGDGEDDGDDEDGDGMGEDDFALMQGSYSGAFTLHQQQRRKSAVIARSRLDSFLQQQEEFGESNFADDVSSSVMGSEENNNKSPTKIEKWDLSQRHHRKCKMLARVFLIRIRNQKKELKRAREKLYEAGIPWKENEEEEEGENEGGRSPKSILSSSSSQRKNRQGGRSIVSFNDEENDKRIQCLISREVEIRGIACQTEISTLGGDENNNNSSSNNLLFGSSSSSAFYSASSSPFSSTRRGGATRIRSPGTPDAENIHEQQTGGGGGKKKQPITVFAQSQAPRKSLSSLDADTVEADTDFFGALADALTEPDSSTVVRARVFRRLNNSLDSFLTPLVGSLTIPLRKEILRCRDWVRKNKVDLVQQLAKASASSDGLPSNRQRPISADHNKKPLIEEEEEQRRKSEEYQREQLRLRYAHVHVARPHAAPSKMIQPSESAKNSHHLPQASQFTYLREQQQEEEELLLQEQEGEESKRKHHRPSSPDPTRPSSARVVVVATGVFRGSKKKTSSGAETARASGRLTRDLHPHLDKKMHERHEALAALSREMLDKTVQEKKSLIPSRPESGRKNKAPLSISDARKPLDGKEMKVKGEEPLYTHQKSYY